MIRIVMLLAVSLGAVLLSACGQKGPLYFPPANAEPYKAPERSAPPEFPELEKKPAPSEQIDAPSGDAQPAS